MDNKTIMNIVLAVVIAIAAVFQFKQGQMFGFYVSIAAFVAAVVYAVKTYKDSKKDK